MTGRYLKKSDVLRLVETQSDLRYQFDWEAQEALRRLLDDLEDVDVHVFDDENEIFAVSYEYSEGVSAENGGDSGR